MQNYRKNFKKAILANIVIVAFLLTLVPFSMIVLLRTNQSVSGLYILLGGIVFWHISYFLACYYLAKSKGYSGWYTLFGLLSGYLGLIVILLLPNKTLKR